MVDLSGGQGFQLHHGTPRVVVFKGSLVAWIAFGLLLFFLTIKLYKGYKKRVNLPVIGSSGIFGSWLAFFRYRRNARAYIHEGYEKHKNYAFQVATPTQWQIFICDKEMIKEYRNVDPKILSASAVTADFLQAKYTIPAAAEGIHKIPTSIIAKGLSWQRMRSLKKEDNYFSEFYDELMYAFAVEIPIADEGWTVVPCFATVSKIITHITAKSLVGRPLCRDPELLQLFLKYASVVLANGWFIAMFPGFVKPLVALVCDAPKMAKRLESIIMELMSQRRTNEPSMPNDLVDWMTKWVRENAASDYSEHDIAIQIVGLVFGGIHSTTQVLVHCLFEISTRTEYTEPLRQEVQQCLKEYGGWNKEALEGMKKLDSFVTECQRYNPMAVGSLARRAAKDFTFSNGLYIPAGNDIYAPSSPKLADENNYPNPERFDGLRHYRLRQEAGQAHNHTFVSASTKNLQFGDGRHVCPGRFMAADEIRLLLAHIILNYDVAIKDHGPRPANKMFSHVLLPNLDAQIMFRKI